MLHPHTDPDLTLSPLLRARLPESLPVLGCIHFPHSGDPSASSSRPATVWASFPPTVTPPVVFVVISTYPDCPPEQHRLFCSLDSSPDPSEEEVEQGNRLVRGAINELSAHNGSKLVLSCLHTRWMPLLGSGHVYQIWLAPERWTHLGPPPKECGVVLREGQEHDLEEVDAHPLSIVASVNYILFRS